jgi:hypothetical protein
MTKAEAAAIAVEIEARKARAPRAHALAPEIETFLESPEARGLGREERERWERILICVSECDGRRYADVKESDEAWLMLELEASKERARQHGAVRS